MDDHLKILLNKWQQQRLSDQELKQLLQYTKDPDRRAELENWLQLQYDKADDGAYFSIGQKRELYNNAIHFGKAPSEGQDDAPKALMHKEMHQRSKKSAIWGIVAAAACILGCCFLLFYKTEKAPSPDITQTGALTNDIAAPLTATPTISWGQNTNPVNIDQAIKHQATRIKRDKDGCLVFSSAGPSAAPSTVVVPRGSRPVHIKLPDGSQVWINTGSSLRFPGTFSSGKRTVYLTGEAYFEVVHKNNQVFEVSQGANTISVLGTHFNINAYADNPRTKITLLEGLVQINHSTYLHPREQADLKGGQMQLRKDVDLQQVMAWKNNQFFFNGTSAQEILRQLARWYNIELVYKGQMPEGRYSGIISKDNSLTQVLAILEAGGIKFKLEQQTLWIF